LKVWRLAQPDTQALAALAQRSMTLQCLIQDGRDAESPAKAKRCVFAPEIVFRAEARRSIDQEVLTFSVRIPRPIRFRATVPVIRCDTR